MVAEGIHTCVSVWCFVDDVMMMRMIGMCSYIKCIYLAKTCSAVFIPFLQEYKSVFITFYFSYFFYLGTFPLKPKYESGGKVVKKNKIYKACGLKPLLATKLVYIVF